MPRSKSAAKRGTEPRWSARSTTSTLCPSQTDIPTMKRAAPETHRARILIVDDHPLVRSGLKLLIDCEPDLSVCGEAANATEAMRLLDSQKPDLLIVDLSLKESSGLELIKRIKARNPDAKMLVSSMFEESLYAERVLS